jgi:hypothetical protein
MLLDDRCVPVRDSRHRDAADHGRTRSTCSILENGKCAFGMSYFYINGYVILGDPSCDDIQVTSGLCVDDSTLAAYHEKDMDEPTAVGRVHSLCKGDCTGKFRSASAATERPAARVGGQTAESQVRVAGLCDEEGTESGARSRIS